MDNLGLQIFLAIWTVLDAIFTFIDESFTAIFSSLPLAAIPYVIGIFCYSMIAIVIVLITRQEAGNKKLGLKLFYYGLILIMLMFSVWRFGIISMIEPELTTTTITQFIINVIYIGFAILLLITFYRKVTWLKKAIIFLLWFLLLLITFVLAPVFTDYQISENAFFQVLLLGALFIIPHGFHQYQIAKKSGVD